MDRANGRFRQSKSERGVLRDPSVPHHIQVFPASLLDLRRFLIFDAAAMPLAEVSRMIAGLTHERLRTPCRCLVDIKEGLNWSGMSMPA